MNRLASNVVLAPILGCACATANGSELSISVDNTCLSDGSSAITVREQDAAAGESVGGTFFGSLTESLVRGFSAAILAASGAGSENYTLLASRGISAFYEAYPKFRETAGKRATETTVWEIRVPPQVQCLVVSVPAAQDGNPAFAATLRLDVSDDRRSFAIVPTSVDYREALDSRGRKGSRDFLITVAYATPGAKDPFATFRLPLAALRPGQKVPTSSLNIVHSYSPLPSVSLPSSSVAAERANETVKLTALNVSVTVTETKQVNQLLKAIAKALESTSSGAGAAVKDKL